MKARLARKSVKSEVTEEDEMLAKRSELDVSTNKMLGACLIDGKVGEGGSVKSDFAGEVAPDEEELELRY